MGDKHGLERGKVVIIARQMVGVTNLHPALSNAVPWCAHSDMLWPCGQAYVSRAATVFNDLGKSFVAWLSAHGLLNCTLSHVPGS